MCKLCDKKSGAYRRIYKNHYGPIPVDMNGNSYHIHHIDGNRYNNDPDNLIALSAFDHYKIHYEQKDYAAALLLAKKIKINDKIISEISSKNQLQKVKNGTHPFIKTGKDHPGYNHTLFTFENIYTGEIVEHTKNDMVKLYGLPTGITQLVSGKSKRCGDWKLPGTSIIRNTQKGKDHFWYDHTLYSFENIKTGEIIISTRYDFYTKFDFSASAIINLTANNGKNKSAYGWKISSYHTHDARLGPKYHFYHKKNNVSEYITQADLCKKYNLNAGHICQLTKPISKVKSVKGWTVILDTTDFKE